MIWCAISKKACFGESYVRTCQKIAWRILFLLPARFSATSQSQTHPVVVRRKQPALDYFACVPRGCGSKENVGLLCRIDVYVLKLKIKFCWITWDDFKKRTVNTVHPVLPQNKFYFVQNVTVFEKLI
jgi:hypothetical protein